MRARREQGLTLGLKNENNRHSPSFLCFFFFFWPFPILSYVYSLPLLRLRFGSTAGLAFSSWKTCGVRSHMEKKPTKGSMGLDGFKVFGIFKKKIKDG